MNIVDTCARIVSDYETLRQTQAAQAAQNTIANILKQLEDAGRLPLVAYEPEWIADLIFSQEVIFDNLILGWLSHEAVRHCVNEALKKYPLPVPFPPLRERPEGEVWAAVKVNETLFCCKCRSLYEGIPLTEHEVDEECEQQGMLSCGECGISM